MTDPREAIVYHVAPEGHQGDLLSLHAQHGDEAYDIYLDRWPESQDLGTYHAHVIHCYATRAEAEEHAVAFGGDVLEIDTADLEVRIDALEFPHPVVDQRIPAASITSDAR